MKISEALRKLNEEEDKKIKLNRNLTAINEDDKPERYEQTSFFDDKTKVKTKAEIDAVKDKLEKMLYSKFEDWYHVRLQEAINDWIETGDYNQDEYRRHGNDLINKETGDIYECVPSPDYRGMDWYKNGDIDDETNFLTGFEFEYVDLVLYKLWDEYTQYNELGTFPEEYNPRDDIDYNIRLADELYSRCKDLPESKYKGVVNKFAEELVEKWLEKIY